MKCLSAFAASVMLCLACPLARAAGEPGAVPASASAPLTSLEGRWMCAVSPIRLDRMHGIPPGAFTQMIALLADREGQWSSNAITTFRADSGEVYKVNSTSNGMSRMLSGQRLREAIIRFELQKPYDVSTPFAQTNAPRINLILMTLVKSSLLREYRMHDVTQRSFVLEALSGNKEKSFVRSACVRIRETH